MMHPKPSIAVLLGSHHDDEHEEEEHDEHDDGDLDEHGESLMDELYSAWKSGDHAKAWSCFKKLDELAEHCRGEEDEGDEEED